MTIKLVPKSEPAFDVGPVDKMLAALQRAMDDLIEARAKGRTPPLNMLVLFTETDGQRVWPSWITGGGLNHMEALGLCAMATYAFNEQGFASENEWTPEGDDIA